MHSFFRNRASALNKRWLLVACAALVAPVCISVAAHGQQPITNVQAIRGLGSPEAALGRSIHLQGVVTAISGWKNSFFLQDAGAGISIDRDSASPEVRAGQRVAIEGVTAAGKFAPIVKATQVRVLGPGSFPAPRTTSAEALTAGSLDSQWTTVRGFVRTATVTHMWQHDVLSLEMDLGEGNVVTAIIREYPGEDWHHLPGSMVSVRGACGTIFNDRRQFLRARFFVNNLHDIKVLRAGPLNLFERPSVPVSSLGRFSSGAGRFEPFKIHGVLTSVQSADRIYVQSGAEGVLVHTGFPVRAARGAEVEVVGFARQGDYAPSLEGAVLHLMSDQRKLPAPTPVEAGKVITDKDGFPSAPYDALLVRVTGTLSQVIPNPDETILLLRAGNTFFGAVLPKDALKGNLPEIGSVLAVEGVCFTRVNSSHEPTGFRVLLQSLSDVTVVRGASWWTAQHAKEVALGMTFAVLLMAALLFFFRRESALRELSVSDPLTGVYNRRGFVLLAEQQWRQALRHRESMELFYIDVDDFKQINDTLGHKQGDLAIQAVATLLRDCFRSSDIIGRLGGDEFAIVAPKAGPRTNLKARLERLVEQHNKSAGHAFELSLSIGVLQCDSSLSEHSIEDLLTRADVLMYGDKTKRKSGQQSAAPAMHVHSA